MRRVVRRTLACSTAGALALAAGAAGCGGGSSPPEQARSPCPPAIRAAVATLPGGQAAARASAAVDDRAPDVLTCTYRAGAPAAEVVRVTVDGAPQAAWRFSRAVVERAQAHLGGDRRELPRQVDGVGANAAWAAAPRELTATGGRRLVTVTIVAHGSGAPPDRAAAIAVARAALR